MSPRASSLCRGPRSFLFVARRSSIPWFWPRSRSRRASPSLPWSAPSDYAHAATGRSSGRRRLVTAREEPYTCAWSSSAAP
eukprot:6170178-Pyramimonas_sp.AAC.1